MGTLLEHFKLRRTALKVRSKISVGVASEKTQTLKFGQKSRYKKHYQTS